MSKDIAEMQNLPLALFNCDTKGSSRTRNAKFGWR